jgi:hypothetical protein
VVRSRRLTFIQLPRRPAKASSGGNRDQLILWYAGMPINIVLVSS